MATWCSRRHSGMCNVRRVSGKQAMKVRRCSRILPKYAQLRAMLLQFWRQGRPLLSFDLERVLLSSSGSTSGWPSKVGTL
jgi:hypothetical protein